MPSTRIDASFLASAIDFRRVVAAGAGEHGNAAGSFFERDFHDAQMLSLAERGIFAGGAAGHQKINSRIDLAAHQPAQSRLVERRDRAEME